MPPADIDTVQPMVYLNQSAWTPAPSLWKHDPFELTQTYNCSDRSSNVGLQTPIELAYEQEYTFNIQRGEPDWTGFPDYIRDNDTLTLPSLEYSDYIWTTMYFNAAIAFDRAYPPTVAGIGNFYINGAAMYASDHDESTRCGWRMASMAAGAAGQDGTNWTVVIAYKGANIDMKEWGGRIFITEASAALSKSTRSTSSTLSTSTSNQSLSQSSSSVPSSAVAPIEPVQTGHSTSVSPGAVAGAVLGAASVFIVFGIVLFSYVRRRRHHHRNQRQEEQLARSDPTPFTTGTRTTSFASSSQPILFPRPSSTDVVNPKARIANSSHAPSAASASEDTQSVSTSDPSTRSESESDTTEVLALRDFHSAMQRAGITLQTLVEITHRPRANHAEDMDEDLPEYGTEAAPSHGRGNGE